MIILSIDPGTRNLGIALVQYEGSLERGGITVPKRHACCQALNYRILWLGVFELGSQSSTHEEMAERLSVILHCNRYLTRFMNLEEVRDVIIETQEGENSHSLLRGLMRPNWISGVVAGHALAKGKRIHVVGKTQKWGWSTFRAFERNKGGTKEMRKAAIATFVRYMACQGRTTEQVTEACRNSSNSVLNHVGDAVVQAMYYLRAHVLQSMFPERERCAVDNKLVPSEIEFVQKNIRKRKW